MNRRSICVALMVSLSLVTVGRTMAAQDAGASAQANAQAKIRALVDTYMQSVDDADPKLAAAVWLTTPDASFIEPLGHERGWDQIADVIYGKLMGQTFVKRTLKNVSDVTIHVYGDAAVVEFDWDFVAILRSDGKTEVHTTGRESQFYVNLPEQGWRLVHVHYSGPPVKGPGGF
jgi:ketosteroid isomerase-like protein